MLVLLQSSGELTQSADLDCLLDAPLLPNQKLEADIRRIFIPIRTVCVSIVLLLVQVRNYNVKCGNTLTIPLPELMCMLILIIVILGAFRCEVEKLNCERKFK